MWMKLTDKDRQNREIEDRRKRLPWAVLLGILIFLGVVFCQGGRFTHHHSGPKTIYEMSQDFPFALFFAPLATWIMYRYGIMKNKRITVICPRCEKVEYRGFQTQCSCGGHFENIDDMKWIEEKKE